MSGTYSGFPGHPGSGAPEMPPLGRPPVHAPTHTTSPGDDHRVSEPTPLKPRLEAPTEASSGSAVATTDVTIGPTGRPLIHIPEPGPVTTTQVYTLVTVDSLREVYAAAHPRALG